MKTRILDRTSQNDNLNLTGHTNVQVRNHWYDIKLRTIWEYMAKPVTSLGNLYIKYEKYMSKTANSIAVKVFINMVLLGVTAYIYFPLSFLLFSFILYFEYQGGKGRYENSRGDLSVLGLSFCSYALPLVFASLIIFDPYVPQVLQNANLKAFTSSELGGHSFVVHPYNDNIKQMTFMPDGRLLIKKEYQETKSPEGLKILYEVPDSVLNWEFHENNIHIEGLSYDMTLNSKGYLKNGNEYIGEITAIDISIKSTDKVSDELSRLIEGKY